MNDETKTKLMYVAGVIAILATVVGLSSDTQAVRYVAGAIAAVGICCAVGFSTSRGSGIVGRPTYATPERSVRRR